MTSPTKGNPFERIEDLYTWIRIWFSPGQYTFPAVQVPSVDANTLDDYEEGPWTAVFTPISSGTISLDGSYNTGRYTKVGRLVFLTGLFIVQSVNSPIGFVRITGLPFSPGLAGQGSVSILVTDMEATAIEPYMGFVSGSPSCIWVSKLVTGVHSDCAADFKANSQLYLAAQYSV